MGFAQTHKRLRGSARGLDPLNPLMSILGFVGEVVHMRFERLYSNRMEL